MKSQERATVYLKDYQPPTHDILDLSLKFEIFDPHTKVVNTLRIKPLAAHTQLTLDGENLKLESVRLNGTMLDSTQYQVTAESLTLSTPKTEFSLEITTLIEPEKNTELSGLYTSKGLLCTQCEAQGFRRITYFLDRPDVMTVYTTTIQADAKKYPLLLANGNKISGRTLPEGRHEAVWQDPFKKPCYLFALVAGQLECIEDEFITQSGRRVCLQIFVESGHQDQVHHAMESLKKSMRWDEVTYGREYDLDIFMIVAVDDFNFGAMENKGLNIFNSKYILAKPETATDSDFEHIESVVAHEYFHNWTGNRITCRDWFQLSLKEGLTVFRDQEFSSDMNSRAVKRIQDVNMLRTQQFAEDAGPMAHPIRPASYMEINNFYTLTVYEKGAEVIRMIHTLLGPDRFRKGMDKYFELHDGQAVTTEDFVSAMENASGKDLMQFKNWYNQAGTPEVFAEEVFDAATKKLTIKMRQRCRPTPEANFKNPFLIPIKTALVLPTGEVNQEKVLELSESTQEFVFENVPAKPVVSYLRDFSAPIVMHTPHQTQDLLFLLANDNNSFQRWESLQKLWQQWVLENLRGSTANSTPLTDIVSALKKPLTDSNLDPAMRSLLLNVPNEVYFQTVLDPVDVSALYNSRKKILDSVAENLKSELASVYDWTEDQLQSLENKGVFDGKAASLRALKNSCLNLLVRADESWCEKAFKQLQTAPTMSDQIQALLALTQVPNQRRQEGLTWFKSKWGGNYLVMNKWLTLQAMTAETETLDRVKSLASDKAVFDRLNPNNVYSLLVAFSQQNLFGFHSRGGEAYEFIADEVLALDKQNPQVAARLVRAFNQWKRYEEPERDALKQALLRMKNTKTLSRNVFEIVSKALAD